MVLHLLEESSFLRSLFQNVSDAILVVDKDGVVTGANAAFEKMTGWTASEVVGHGELCDICRGVATCSEESTCVECFLKKSSVSSFEMHVRTRDLHDGIGQALFSIMVGLKVVNQLDLEPAMREHLDEVQKLTAKTLDEVKNLSVQLRPAQIEIPKGAKVHFNVTSKDVAHGFEIPGTNVNMMILPGHVNSVTHTFAESGDFLILCNEYCGVAHHMMMANIVVK